MTARTVAIGETSSCRYIGVKPPLEDALAEHICKAAILPDWVELPDLSCMQRVRTQAPDHTEFGFEVSFGLDYLGQDIVDSSTARVAHQIAQIMRSLGDEVTVLEGVFPTDFQSPLFSEEYFDMRRVAEYFHPHGEQS